jgi:hypothetical protein
MQHHSRSPRPETHYGNLHPISQICGSKKDKTTCEKEWGLLLQAVEKDAKREEAETEGLGCP